MVKAHSQLERSMRSGVGLCLAFVFAAVTTLADQAPVADQVSAADQPNILYLLYCGGCHLPDGSGVPPQVPTLHDQPGVIEGLPGGRDYLIRVPGAAQAPMTDAELAIVVNYLLETFSADTLAKDFKPYTAAEVAGYRRNILLYPLARRAEILGTAR
jgi:mono/diheme cytochrome c family protein